jgi:hypothetical protein
MFPPFSNFAPLPLLWPIQPTVDPSFAYFGGVIKSGANMLLEVKARADCKWPFKKIAIATNFVNICWHFESLQELFTSWYFTLHLYMQNGISSCVILASRFKHCSKGSCFTLSKGTVHCQTVLGSSLHLFSIECVLSVGEQLWRLRIVLSELLVE